MRSRKKGRDEPVDPYAGAAASSGDVAAQVDFAIGRMNDSIKGCHRNVGSPTGTVRIAFQVLDNGTLAHAATIANSTHSDQLAACIVDGLYELQLPTHSGGPVDFVRPFEFR